MYCSVYEALTIQKLVLCNSKERGFYHIWYLYIQAALQLLQVRCYKKLKYSLFYGRSSIHLKTCPYIGQSELVTRTQQINTSGIIIIKRNSATILFSTSGFGFRTLASEYQILRTTPLVRVCFIFITIWSHIFYRNINKLTRSY